MEFIIIILVSLLILLFVSRAELQKITLRQAKRIGELERTLQQYARYANPEAMNRDIRLIGKKQERG
jgi:hypothetical protein